VPPSALLGPDANELLLFDRDKIFSSEQGWGPILNLLFPRGLMLMDFDKHRADRKALSVAFKPEPMRHYATELDAGIEAAVGGWAGQTLRFYDAVKKLTLDLAATSFLGVPLGAEADKINQAFVDEVQASVSPIRKPWPGTQMRKGVRARAYLVDFFEREIPARRTGTGQDFFSQFCRATDDDGAPLTALAIADHMNFLMMAAHDTITSSATSLVMLLARNPDWQERLREEVAALDPAVPLTEQLDRLVLTEYAFKESLRMMPPVPSIPRRALKDFSFGGFDIPAGTNVGTGIIYTHRMAEHWPDPDRFDPLRPPPVRVGPVRRRRTHVHRTAFRDDADAAADRTPAHALPDRGGGGQRRCVAGLPDPAPEGWLARHVRTACFPVTIRHLRAVHSKEPFVALDPSSTLALGDAGLCPATTSRPDTRRSDAQLHRQRPVRPDDRGGPADQPGRQDDRLCPPHR
jgi:cytochrome P450